MTLDKTAKHTSFRVCSRCRHKKKPNDLISPGEQHVAVHYDNPESDSDFYCMSCWAETKHELERGY